ncbi:MAG: galactonate dehydratase, partial [Peptoniphilaceae bacterium]|nr:galactonate dehydratase [Peptoniphilaceae bacterium]
DSIKMNATEELHYIDSFKKIEEVSKRVSALRERFGYDLNIGIDFHGRVHKSMAKVLAKELEQYKPMFLEEVVLPENEDSFKTIANITSTPLATGERIYSRWGFKNIFKEGIIDIIQPDVALVGGINELKKIASTAESLDIAVAPHAPYGPIALAATLQVDVCTPNVFIQEQSLGIHYNKGFDLLDFVENKEIFQYDEGFVKIPQEPGLGVKLNEEMIDEVSKEKINRENPSWKNYDGTIAEW